jgi:hypothetical protein
VAFHVKLDQYFLIFALSAEIDLIAAGIFPARKIEWIGKLKDFVDIQIIRA